jgi:hypothetical protein
MRKFSLLSGLFPGIISNVGLNQFYLWIGDDSHKGPPGIRTVDLAYLISKNWTFTNNRTSNNIISPFLWKAVQTNCYMTLKRRKLTVS